ncbi:hypothetical protein ACLB2K_058296 [Fragaria x ananassa]
MGLAPSCSETTVSDNRTEMAKVVNPKPKPKQARKSEKRPTNDNRDWVDDLSVEPPMSPLEEALIAKLRADFEQRGKDTSRAEASIAAGERAEKPDETHLKTEVRVETEVHEECNKSPSKLVQIGKRRKVNHGSSLFNFINIQHKQSNPHQKLSQTVRYELSQKWRQLPPDEKEKYKVEPKVKEDCVGSGEAVELFSLNTRCSPKRFRSVVSEFTDAQKVACEELGFGTGTIADTINKSKRKMNRDNNNELVRSMGQVLNRLSFELSSSCCIYRVPKRLRRASENAYTPQVVSIGPLHHGNEGLKPMEELKNRYLKVFLRRTKVTLEAYVGQIKNKEVDLRSCYAETIDLHSDDFVRIVLVDAAFVIEVLLRFCFPECQEENDRIFRKPFMLQDVWPDMRMLENQLPFFILDDLFEPHKATLSKGISLIVLSHHFFKTLMHIDVADQTLRTIKPLEIVHFVDFVRKLYPLPPWDSQKRRSKEIPVSPTMTQLSRAGVKFRKGSEANMFDVKFEHGYLEMPKLTISDQTEVTITNLIAFEQSQCNDKEKYINDYFVFLNGLVKTPQDVDLLVSHGILDNKLGDSKKGCALIKNLVDGVVDYSKDYFYFIKLCDDLNEYYTMGRHQWKEYLVTHFLYSPWATKEIITVMRKMQEAMRILNNTYGTGSR